MDDLLDDLLDYLKLVFIGECWWYGWAITLAVAAMIVAIVIT